MRDSTFCEDNTLATYYIVVHVWGSRSESGTFTPDKIQVHRQYVKQKENTEPKW
jgi:hypothetical protein